MSSLFIYIPLGCIGFILYLIIGMKIGAIGWRQWQKNTTNSTVWNQTLAMHILFPLTTLSGEFRSRELPTALISEYDDRDLYLKVMAFLWPLKLVWCLPLAVLIQSIRAILLLIRSGWRAMGRLLSALASLFDERREYGLWRSGLRPKIMRWLGSDARFWNRRAEPLHEPTEHPGETLGRLKQDIRRAEKEMLELQTRRQEMIEQADRLERQQAAEEGTNVYRANRNTGSRWYPSIT